MSAPAKVLVVDDTPPNVKLLADLLTVKGYAVATAVNGEEALVKVASEQPDLILLDIMMPGLSGYDVCQRLRADPKTALLPIVLVTSLDPQQERIKGIEAGADDFLGKPINQPELFARVRSLLRVKSLQDEVRQQAEMLHDWNVKLEERVTEQVAQLERMGQLKRFFAPAVADAPGQRCAQPSLGAVLHEDETASGAAQGGAARQRAEPAGRHVDAGAGRDRPGQLDPQQGRPALLRQRHRSAGPSKDLPRSLTGT